MVQAPAWAPLSAWLTGLGASCRRPDATVQAGLGEARGEAGAGSVAVAPGPLGQGGADFPRTAAQGNQRSLKPGSWTRTYSGAQISDWGQRWD